MPSTAAKFEVQIKPASLLPRLTGIGLAALALMPTLMPDPAEANLRIPRGAATCEFNDVEGTLTVLAGNPKTMAVSIGRDGNQITVSDTQSGRSNQITCGGPTATVTNTDLVAVDATLARREQAVTIDMTNGRFEPGITDEADGSSEIEFDVSIEQRGQYPEAYLNIIGTPDADVITLGAKGNDTAANLNADEATPDLDLLLHQRLAGSPRSQVKLQAFGGQGDDQISGLGGPLFSDAMDLGYGDLRISGGEGADTLTGGLDDDRIFGGADNDVIEGDSGYDRLSGGAGNDTLTDREGESWMGGGEGDDVLTGGSLADDIDGDAGNDTIDGADGDDYLSGGSGEDTVGGGLGRDRISGGAGDDALSGGAKTDRIGGDAGSDQIKGGIGSDQIDGGKHDDVINAGRGNDTVDGGGGSDQINGEDGDDILFGDGRWDRDGAADTIVAGRGKDRVDGRKGADLIDTKDKSRDVIACDRRGEDQLTTDRRDVIKPCKSKRDN